jgi:uncharacterized Zn-binding protein involved in type VI secretion
MRGIARLGDKTYGTCYAHDKPLNVTGKIVSASQDTFCDTHGVARLGDMVLTECGHTGKIISASQNVLCNELGVARLGDEVNGDYIARIISASTTTFINTVQVASTTGDYQAAYTPTETVDVIVGDYLTLEDGITPLLSEDLQPILI